MTAYPIEKQINEFNVTIEKGVKYWECIISDKEYNDVDFQDGFTSNELALEWAETRCNQ